MFFAAQLPRSSSSTGRAEEGSILDGGASGAGGYYTAGRHASLMTCNNPGAAAAARLMSAGDCNLVGQKVSYLDSGYSEESDPAAMGQDQQQTSTSSTTSCLVKTASGSVYIPRGDLSKNPTMDSRLDYRLNQSPSCQSPTKDVYRTLDRNNPLHYATAETPFLRESLQKRSTRGVGGVGAIGAGSAHGSSRFEKGLAAKRLSWRCLAVFFIVMALILAAALAYVTASSFFPKSLESAKACAVVVSDDEQQMLQHPNQQLAAASTGEGALLAPAAMAPRNLPPDGTSFQQMSFGSRMTSEISPYGYWNMQFLQAEPGYVVFALEVPRGSSLGVYARKNALPTHTNYDIVEVVKGSAASGGVSETRNREKRSTKRTVIKELSLYLAEGHWFLSLYNDFGDAQSVSMVASPSRHMTESCPKGCSDRGECVLGRCQCEKGFGGEDCSQGVCPVLCSGHGDYASGACDCHPGWKGRECSLRHDECETAHCNGHGRCKDGACNCIKGFAGEFCEKVDCPDPSCSGHGFCLPDGVCICRKGWKGPSCSDVDEDARQCLPDCSGHGRFDLDAQKCHCHAGWTGEDCAARMCDLHCGDHGRCEDNACVCESGWSGLHCGDRTCDARCAMHGQCKNGTCLCVTGWNGLHCTLEGCPRQCSGHGACKADVVARDWSCKCDKGWEGEACDVRTETDCTDGKDNDADGLTDCEDPECCALSTACKASQLCQTVPKPIDILLQRQPPAATATFFQKMRFIIEEGSLQRYAKNSAFNESIGTQFNQSSSAVIRGRVTTSSGRGLVGVRVTHESLHTEGYTMTQDDGWFDFMVNGGGAVQLKFGKSPFQPQTRSLFVPWNEVVVIDPVVMYTERESEPLASVSSNSTRPCMSHDFDVMRPIILASWRLAQHAAPASLASEIVAESRVVQEVVALPNSQVKLVYNSARTRGYLSTIELRLTPAAIPPTLSRVHLKISVEGVLFEKTFEADPGLMFTYAWPRLNIYRQRVYGITNAVVKVGYAYTDCAQTIWDVQTTQLLGQDLSTSDIAGWDFNIHHRYNPMEGILYKGDGSTVFLRERPRLISSVLGDGKARSPDCGGAACHSGEAHSQRLLSPMAMAAAADGSVYVADYDLVRRIGPDGRVNTILKLKSAAGAYRFHLAVSPQDDTLYVSDSESHQILRVRNAVDPNDVEKNWERVVGTGQRCLPGDESLCGDGGAARDARLMYPKGLAISADNTLYFADGMSLRMVRDGVITTVLGGRTTAKGQWQPMACSGSLPATEAVLKWPTEVAINPMDNTVHFVDDHLVMRLTPDQRVQMVAGRPLHCHRPANDHYLNFATQTTLVAPQSIAFSSKGELFIAESDSRRTNRVSMVSPDSRISVVVGKESKCNCQEPDCPCVVDGETQLASEVVLGSVNAIAVSPAGELYLSDQSSRRILFVRSSVPELTQLTQEYRVHSTETQEVYVFNRFGLHMETRHIPSERLDYKFSYSVTTSNGRLIGISNAVGSMIKVVRDYSGQVTAIENALQQRFDLIVDRKQQMLLTLRLPGGMAASVGGNASSLSPLFSYHRSTDLIRSKRLQSGDQFFYDYDDKGRVSRVVTPTGEAIHFQSDLEIRGAVVNITRNARHPPLSLLIQPGLVQASTAQESEVIQMHSDRSFTTNAKWGGKFTLRTAPYKLLLIDDAYSGLAESFPVPTAERTDLGRDTVNMFEWQYFATRQQMGKKLRVNGENILGVEVSRSNDGSEIVNLERSQVMLNVSSGVESARVTVLPSGLFAAVSIERNRNGQTTLWRWGEMRAERAYDALGRLTELRLAGDRKPVMGYEYASQDSTKPSKISTARSSVFALLRDEGEALKSAMTPRGHIYGFSSRVSLGFKRFDLIPPWSRQPYQLHFDASGNLLAKVYPDESAKVVYLYDGPGRLRAILAGAASVTYHHIASTGLTRAIDVDDEEVGSHLKIDMKYHIGLLKEFRQSFESRDKTTLDDVSIKYQYDGSARVAAIATSMGKDSVVSSMYKYDSVTGALDAAHDLRIRRESLRKTVIEDSTKSFSVSKDTDVHGRLSTVALRVKGTESFKMSLDYNDRGQLAKRRVELANREPSVDSFSYNADGLLEAVKNGGSSDDDWLYEHDANGNIVSASVGGGKKVSFGYDAGDRVVMVGDLEYVVYDERGFVVRRGEQRYTYNALGQMTTASEPGRFTVRFYYDDLGRLIAKRDHKGNAVQFVYSNPNADWLSVTHIHYPQASRTYQLLYSDEKGRHLVALDTVEERFYIGADQIGSPVAIFDKNGRLVKEVTRSPFGRIVKDSNPSLDVPLGFGGGLLDQYTHLVHFGDRVYDPVVGQWMTPAWEKLAALSDMRSPFDLFAYRLKHNSPIAAASSAEPNLMNDASDWLEMLGYRLPNIAGYPRDWTEQRGRKSPDSCSSESCSAWKAVDITVGLRNKLRQSYTNLQQAGLLSSMSSESSKESAFQLPVFADRPASKAGLFGKGFLLTDVDGRAMVTHLDGFESDVVSNVLSSVLNASLIVEASYSGRETFYFLKEEERAFADDYQELQRLSGSFNVSADAVTRGAKGDRQVCVQDSDGAKLCLLYGLDRRAANRHIMRAEHKMAAQRAWQREARAVRQAAAASSAASSVEWTHAQRNELLHHGEVRGFQAVEVHSVHKHPALLGQSSNIVFVKDSDVAAWHSARRKAQ